MLGVIGFIISLIFVVITVYKGWDILPVSIIGGILVALSNQMNLWEALSVDYADGLGGYVASYFLIFMLGAFFGELISVTGSAKAISYKLMDVMGAKRAPLAVVIVTLLLTYGGVNSFIVVFTLYPIAVVLFNEAKIPRRILAACILFGCGTITQSSMPGTPAIQNLIPATYFNTPTTAAPVTGIVTSVITMVLGMAYIEWQVKKAAANGEVFVPVPNDNLSANIERDTTGLPDWKIAVAPVLVVIVLILALTSVLPALAAVSVGLLVAIVMTYALNWKRIENPVQTMTDGCVASIMPLLNTAAIVAYGAIVKSSPSFQSMVDFTMNLNYNPYVTTALGVNIIAGITGSASGGIIIFLDNMGEFLLQQGADPAALHRLVSIAAAGLDTLPHNGAVVSIFAVIGTTHKESYKDVFAVTVTLSVLITVVAVVMAMMGITY